jgi:hypothetical protein
MSTGSGASERLLVLLSLGPCRTETSTASMIDLGCKVAVRGCSKSFDDAPSRSPDLLAKQSAWCRPDSCCSCSSQIAMLHRRLVLAMAAEQEREGHRTAMDVMVGSLAHELRQPLGPS